MSGFLLKILALAAVVMWAGIVSWPDNKLHVVFCDVGQGDAILVSRGTNQMLVDGGPDARVLECLNKHLPFWDRRLEVVVLTHPQADHMNGLIKIAERYSILYFVSGPEGNETVGYKDLRSKIQETHSTGFPRQARDFAGRARPDVRNVYSGDEIRMSGVKFRIVWPTREYLAEHTTGEVKVLGMSTDGTDLNEFGISGVLSYGDFDVMLTGDKTVERDLLWDVEVAKVPHHGSKTGLEEAWWEAARPELAIISVGKNNRYGHPAEETLKLLRDEETKILRTDVDGEVEVVSDGIKWWVK